MMEQYKEIAEKLRNADAVLIGASNGLSISEGLHLFADNAAFEELFGDFKHRYGLRCLLHGMAAQWPSEEEKWAFFARMLNHYCVEYKPTQVMADLKALVQDKDYFVVTSNGEGHFQMCGFEPERVYEVEGDWRTMQCSRACHDTLYPALELAEKLVKEEKGGRVPTELVPRCLRCGGPMKIHMEGDAFFVPQTKAIQQYEDFLRRNQDKNIVVLELGIGWRNQLIKGPLMRFVNRHPKATYVTINLGEVYIIPEIQHKSYGLDGYLSDHLSGLRQAYEG